MLNEELGTRSITYPEAKAEDVQACPYNPPDWTPQPEDYQRAFRSLQEMLGFAETEISAHWDTAQWRERVAVAARRGLPKRENT